MVMEYILFWILSFWLGGFILFCIICANVFVLNLFYHLFTGKDLKIYKRLSSCLEGREEDREEDRECFEEFQG